MRSWAGLVVLVLAFSAWVGVGSPSAAQAPPRTAVVSADVVEGVEDLLTRREGEVASGVLGGSVHPDADPASAARWNRLVDGSGVVGLSLYDEELTSPVLDLTPPSWEAAHGGTYIVEVRRSWQVAGVDPHPAQESVFLAVARHDGEWVMVHDDPLRAVGLTSTRMLWEVTDVQVVESGGVKLVGGPGQAARMRQVGDLLRRASAPLQHLEVPQGYLVLVPDGAAQAKEFMQTPLDLSKFVAFVSFSIDTDDAWEAGPPRLVLQEGNLRRRSEARQVLILRHELVHVAALPRSGPMTPIWVHEGYAEWETNARAAVAGGSLPIPDAFTFRTGSVSEIVAAYDRSEQLFARIAGMGGAEVPGAFFDAVGAVRSSAGTVQYHVDRALESFGLDRAGVEQLTQ